MERGNERTINPNLTSLTYVTTTSHGFRSPSITWSRRSICGRFVAVFSKYIEEAICGNKEMSAQSLSKIDTQTNSLEEEGAQLVQVLGSVLH